MLGTSAKENDGDVGGDDSGNEDNDCPADGVEMELQNSSEYLETDE